MGYFPGVQKSTPVSPKKSGGGGGSGDTSKPTPYQTSPAISPEENQRRMAANIKAGVGDAYGRSSGDPDYGKPLSTTTTQEQKVVVTTGPPITNQEKAIARANYLSNIALQQEITRAGREYYSNTLLV